EGARQAARAPRRRGGRDLGTVTRGMAGAPTGAAGDVLTHRGVLAACLFALAIALLAAPARGATHHRIAPDPDWVELQPVRGDAGTAAVADDVRFLLVDDQVNLLGAEPVWHR